MLMCELHKWADLAAILGGIGTFGTFVKLICDSKNKTKQLQAIQNIESRQLDIIYTPDIRIDSYGAMPNQNPTINVLNNGENLMIQSIVDYDSNVQVVNMEGFGNNWFPRTFDKGNVIKIPILQQTNELPRNSKFAIMVTNKLQQQYSCEVIISGNVVRVGQCIKQ